MSATHDQRTYSPGPPPDYCTQGMPAPQNNFVNPDGTLTAVSFRFLFGVYYRVEYLKDQIDLINQRLTNAGIP